MLSAALSSIILYIVRTILRTMSALSLLTTGVVLGTAEGTVVGLYPAALAPIAPLPTLLVLGGISLLLAACCYRLGMWLDFDRLLAPKRALALDRITLTHLHSVPPEAEHGPRERAARRALQHP